MNRISARTARIALLGAVAMVLLVAAAPITRAATPAGGLIAYDRWSPGSRQHRTYVVDTSTGIARSVIATDGSDPVWSPDGQWLVVSRERPAGTGCEGCSELLVVAPDGTHVHRLTHSGGSEAGAVWSPDGKSIAFIHLNDIFDGPGQVHVIGPDGKGLRRLTPLNRDFEGTVLWSADSKSLLIDTGLDGLWIVGADGTGLRRLTPKPIWADRDHPDKRGLEDGFPVWDPQGSGIAFTRDTSSYNHFQSAIYVMTGPKSTPRRLTPSYELADSAAWSPDGKRIAYVVPKVSSALCPGSAIFVVNADGSHRRRLSPWGPGVGSPSWSPDSSQVAYLKQAAGASCDDVVSNVSDVIALVPVLGGHPRVVAKKSPAYWLAELAWQP